MSDLNRDPSSNSRFSIFAPILAGATLRERFLACLGALVGIALTGLVCGYLFGDGPHLPLIVAPIGASAVLLFAVPASPLAQPWSIVGGNTISALVGVLVVRFVHDSIVATGLAVSLAIAAMSLTRSLHPPGGAAALTAVLGGPVVAGWGLLFPLVPVALNSFILVAVGIAFHKLSRRNYPHVAAQPANVHQTRDLPANMRVSFRDEDIDAALGKMHETFDIDRSDIGRLLREIELQATIRAHGDIRCADLMSRDVISVDLDATVEAAHALLIKHNIRTLPVRRRDGKLLGSVGLRELADATGRIEPLMVPAATARPNDPVLGLLPALTNGRSHAVIVVDDAEHVLGLISQTDLLATVATLLPAGHGKDAAA
jgi:CBS domain-containing membrane protein